MATVSNEVSSWLCRERAELEVEDLRPWWTPACGLDLGPEFLCATRTPLFRCWEESKVLGREGNSSPGLTEALATL